MKTKIIALVGAATLLLGASPWLPGQDTPLIATEMKEHQWLKRYVGEWETDVVLTFAADQEPMKMKSTETARMIGPFWMVCEGKSEELNFQSVLTIGFDPEKKKYVATWVDSMSNHLWNYEGTLDESGKVLTFETEGPSPMATTKTSKYKEVTEFKSDDHRVFTSSILLEDGKWHTFVTAHSRRKK